MPDVAQKIFANRPTYNGTAIVTIDKLGGSGVVNYLRPYNSTTCNAPSASGLAAKLDTRFDETTYYTA